MRCVLRPIGPKANNVETASIAPVLRDQCKMSRILPVIE
jgi:hypothetical protein